MLRLDSNGVPALVQSSRYIPEAMLVEVEYFDGTKQDFPIENILNDVSVDNPPESLNVQQWAAIEHAAMRHWYGTDT